MSAIGKSTLSIRKQDLQTQKNLALGVKKIVFYHQASAGDTSINLTSLVMPAYIAAQGKVNPSSAQIASARIYFFQNNLSLSSSLSGYLQQGSYVVTSSTSIQLVNPAAAGEVFIGVIDNVLLPGVRAVDGKALTATGTLAIGATDFNVGQPFLTGQYPLSQVGAVLVYRNGQLQVRNTNNATAGAGADGDYQELPTSGLVSTVIRFNVAPLTGPDAIVVISNGLLAEQPTDSQMAFIETLAGQINSMIPVLADAGGVPQSTFGSNPSSPDLRTFGDQVIANTAQIASNTTTINHLANLVSARYHTTSAQSLTSSAYTVVNFDVQEYDASGIVTPGAAWKFIVPHTAKYRITSFLETGGTASAGNVVQYVLGVNTQSAETWMISAFRYFSSGVTAELPGSITLKLNGGDYVSPLIFHNATSQTLPSTASRAWIAIEELPNP